MAERSSQYIGFSDFTNELGISYVDYLQAKQFEDSIRFGIRQQTKELIASNSQLTAANIRVVDETKDALAGGFAVLSRDLDEVRDSLRDGLQEIRATFEWGFSEALLSLGRLNDTLEELVRVAKTPAQTWAFEQYEIARDEFRRGLYEEALESIHRAISGNGGNPGYKTELRFHFLLGTIRLGSFANCASDVVDLNVAETAFLNAARYGQHDDPKDASMALLGAGRAAYANKKIEAARSHFEDGLRLYDCGETRYQLAKVLCAQRHIEGALQHLEYAIRKDGLYAVKAAGDGEFQKYSTQLDGLCRRLRDEARTLYSTGQNYLQNVQKELLAFRYKEHSLSALARAEVSAFQNYCSGVFASVKSDSLLDYLSSFDSIAESERGINRVFSTFKEAVTTILLSQVSALQKEQVTLTGRPPKEFEWIQWLSSLVFIVLPIGSCMNGVNNRSIRTIGPFDAPFSALLWGLLTAIIFVIVANVLAKSLRTMSADSFKREQNRLRDRIAVLNEIILDVSRLAMPNALFPAPALKALWIGK